MLVTRNYSQVAEQFADSQLPTNTPGKITYKKLILNDRPVTLGLPCSYLQETQEVCSSPVSKSGKTAWHHTATSEP